MQEQVEGAAQEFGGKIQDAVGGATGDAGTQAMGKVRQAAGKLQQSYGDAVDSVREAAADNPIATLAVAVGLGFLLGALWSRRD